MTINQIKEQLVTLNKKQQTQIKGGTSDATDTSKSIIMDDIDVA